MPVSLLSPQLARAIQIRRVIHGAPADSHSRALRELYEASNDQNRFRELLCTEVHTCAHCDRIAWSRHTGRNIDDERVCRACREVHYERCAYCDRWAMATTHVEGMGGVCRYDLDRFFYCNECDTYSEHEHDCDERDCDCEATHRNFEFPANGHGTLANDTRLTVTLPAGTISDAGLAEITELVYREFYVHLELTGGDRYDAHVYSQVVATLDPAWQTRRGNFTKRLSKALYAAHKVNLPPGVLSKVGNLANQHTAAESTFNIELTRDLNMSAAEFYHEDSCWWMKGHSISRCAFKDIGGIGLRSFDKYGDVSGRAWILPLAQCAPTLGDTSGLEPTHNVDTPAYVVFNAYGDLEGYLGARLIAHLTDLSYRKIGLRVGGPMYVNGESATLIASQDVCDNTTSLYINRNWSHPR